MRVALVRRLSAGLLLAAAASAGPAAAPAAVPVPEPEPTACRLTVAGVKVGTGQADVALQLDWAAAPASLAQSEVTVVLVLAPTSANILGSKLLATRRGFTLSMPAKGWRRMVTDLIVRVDGVAHDGSLALFYTADKAAADLRKSGTHTLALPLPPEFRGAAPAAVPGEWFVTVAVFKQDDPKCDQVKSIRYRPLSNTVTQPIARGVPHP